MAVLAMLQAHSRSKRHTLSSIKGAASPTQLSELHELHPPGFPAPFPGRPLVSRGRNLGQQFEQAVKHQQAAGSIQSSSSKSAPMTSTSPERSQNALSDRTDSAITYLADVDTPDCDKSLQVRRPRNWSSAASECSMDGSASLHGLQQSSRTSRSPSREGRIVDSISRILAESSVTSVGTDYAQRVKDFVPKEQTHALHATCKDPGGLLVPKETDQRRVRMSLVSKGFQTWPKELNIESQPPVSSSRRSRRRPRSVTPERSISRAEKPKAVLLGSKGTLTDAQRQENKRLNERLKHFDRRYMEDLSSSKICQQLLRKQQLEAEKAEAEKGRKHKKAYAPAAASVIQPGGLVDTKLERKEAVDFTVVKWSSQKPDFPATDLVKERGKWESASHHVRNEFVVLELNNGAADGARALLEATICSVTINLPGNDSSPRLCRVSYSNESADGPWHDAWRFEIPTKEEFTFSSTHDYNKLANEFKDLLESNFGSIEDAWHAALDLNGDGRLSFLEWTTACSRLKQMPSVKRLKTAVFQDIQQLFDSFDADASGEVGLDDLLEDSVRIPLATWWKLHFVTNHGSNSTTGVHSPLRIYTIFTESSGFERLRERVDSTNAKTRKQQKDKEDLTTAFCVSQLNICAHQIMLREMAQRHELPLNTLEDIHREFLQVDADASGAIDGREFEQLILKLHNAHAVHDVPQGRMRFFWQQADLDGNGEIDFEEFLQWFSKYFFAKENLDLAGRVCATKLVENFYSSMACKRGTTSHSAFTIRHGLHLPFEPDKSH